MKRNTQLEKQAKRIADAIVELVEGTDGPVTLAQVERDVAGFAKEAPPFWRYGFKTGRFYWDGMTEAGEKALEQVMHERRVTVQFVSLLPYILEDCLIKDENWQPIVLLPARAANLDSPHVFDTRFAGFVRSRLIRRAGSRSNPGLLASRQTNSRCRALASNRRAPLCRF